MKKILALVLALCMIFALCACGTKTTTTTTTNADGSTTTTQTTEVVPDETYGKLIIFQSKTEIMEPLTKCVEDFQADTGIEVELWETTGDNYYTDLKTGLSTQAGPTLFSLAPGSQSKEMADYLEDLSDVSFLGKVSQGMVDVVNGKNVGVPYTLEGFGLVYNKSMVDPSTVNTTEALVKYLEKAKGEGLNGLGLSAESYFLIMHILNAPFAVQDDPDAFLASVLKGETKLADVAAFQEFATLMEGIRANCTNPTDIEYGNNCGDFATGKTAMIHQGNWCYSMFADYDVNFDMGIAAVPVAGNDKISVSVPAAWYINTDAKAEEKAAAKAFLEWLYTSEKGQDYLMNQFGFLPVVEGMKSEKLDPLSQAVSDAAAAGKTIPWSLSNWPAGIDSTIAPITANFFVDKTVTGLDLVNQLNDAFVANA